MVRNKTKRNRKRVKISSNEGVEEVVSKFGGLMMEDQIPILEEDLLEDEETKKMLEENNRKVLIGDFVRSCLANNKIMEFPSNDEAFIYDLARLISKHPDGSSSSFLPPDVVLPVEFVDSVMNLSRTLEKKKEEEEKQLKEFQKYFGLFWDTELPQKLMDWCKRTKMDLEKKKQEDQPPSE